MRERRKNTRFPIAYPLECSTGGGKKTLSLTNISESGLAFTSPDSFREKEVMDLYLFLKNRMFNLKAAVVYAKQQGKGRSNSVGVRLLNATEDFCKSLAREAEDIKQFCRESNQYRNKNLSFRQASLEYLSNEKKYS
jgi:hypothetical protein